MKIRENSIPVDALPIRYLTAGSGPPVVLLHAAGESAWDWCWTIERLAARYRCFAPDLPGYSAGAGVDGHTHTSAAYAHIIARFIRRLGLARPILVGNSLGGLVALRIALHDHAAVPGLVLVASAGLGREINPLLLAVANPVAGDLATASAATPLGAWLRTGWRSALLFANPARAPRSWFLEQYRLASSPSFRYATLASLRAQVTPRGQREVLGPELGNLRLPVLLIWGEHDRIIPLEHSRRARRYLRSARECVLPDCGHVPQIEAPDAFCNVLAGFLEPLARPRNKLPRAAA